MIMLISPYVQDEFYKNEYQSREGLGLRYITAYLKHNKIEYDFIDADAYRINEEEVVTKVMISAPEIIGISCVSQRSYITVRKLVKSIRSNGKYEGVMFMGGFFATLAYKEILEDLPEIDFIQCGEGEKVIGELVQKIMKAEDYSNLPGIVTRTRKGLKICEPYYEKDLDSLPFPERDIKIFGKIPRDKIMLRILGGRGCYGNCSFCSVMMHNRPKGKIYRSAQNVVEEIKEIISTYGVHRFAFNDEIFYELSNYGKQWVREFADLINQFELKIEFRIQMRASDISFDELSILKKVGLTAVSVGYESGVQRILDEMNKHVTVTQNLEAAETIKKVGVESLISYITIIPTMSFEELVENFNFLKKIGGKANQYFYNKLNIYYGCNYERILRNRGLLIERNVFYERHNYLYEDDRVKMFADLTEKMKARLVPIRKNVFNYLNEIDDLNVTEAFLDFYTELNDIEVVNLLTRLLGALSESAYKENELMRLIDDFEFTIKNAIIKQKKLIEQGENQNADSCLWN